MAGFFTQKRKLPIWPLLLLAFVLRIVWLGTTPQGASIEEAKFGILLTSNLGTKITDLYWIRLPFALIGVFSIYLFYLLIRKVSKNEKLSIMAASLLTITPWHIWESRIFSWGILIMTVLLLALLNIPVRLLKKSQVTNTLLLIGILLFVFSIFKIPSYAKNDVDYQRNIASKKIPVVLTKVFSNKLVESFRYRETLLFENLDFGNLFFSGYPRPRWGIEEYPKLLLIFLPLLILGFLATDKKTLFLLGTLYVFYILLLAGFGLRDSTWGLPLVLIIVFVVTKGLLKLTHTKFSKIGSFFLILLFVFEFTYFFMAYKSGLTESRFSPRETFFKQLSDDVGVISKDYQRIFVSDRLGSSKIYLDFYTPEIAEKYVYDGFNLKNDSKPENLFIGVLPFDPSPNEILYKKGGKWPEYINVFYDIKDTKHNRDVVVFDSHL